MAFQAALCIREPSVDVTRQRHRPHQPLSRITEVSHFSSPSLPRPEYGLEGDPMSGAGNTQTLRERVRDALQRRVGKGKAVTVKQVARALYPAISERTIENLMAGNNEPRSETLAVLVDFFDQSFADEVYAGRGFRIVKLADHRAVEAAKKIIEGNAELAALEGR